MFEDRADVAAADEDGGGGDEKLFSAAKPLSTENGCYGIAVNWTNQIRN